MKYQNNSIELFRKFFYFLNNNREKSTEIKNDTIGDIGKSNVKKMKMKLKCNYGHELCFQCKSAWHGNEDCDEDREIKDFAVNSGIIPKKCPKCKVWTEKNLGCNHMTCKICQYNWCWLCLNECLPEHYFQEGSPCYGKQFNEHSNPTEIYFMRLFMNHSIYYISTFFIIYVTIFFIQIVFQNRNLLNQRNPNNNGLNNEENQFFNARGRNTNNNDNNLNNIRDIENNLNNNLLENNGNNLNINNQDPINITTKQKFALFIVGECIISIFFFILALSNGFFLIPLVTFLGQIILLNNKYVRMFCFLTFLILYTIFFITGILLSIIWFIITSIFLIYKIIVL